MKLLVKKSSRCNEASKGEFDVYIMEPNKGDPKKIISEPNCRYADFNSHPHDLHWVLAVQEVVRISGSELRCAVRCSASADDVVSLRACS